MIKSTNTRKFRNRPCAMCISAGLRRPRLRPYCRNCISQPSPHVPRLRLKHILRRIVRIAWRRAACPYSLRHRLGPLAELLRDLAGHPYAEDGGDRSVDGLGACFSMLVIIHTMSVPMPHNKKPSRVDEYSPFLITRSTALSFSYYDAESIFWMSMH